jgi:hypothetical protein
MSESLSIPLTNRQQAWSVMERDLFPFLKQALQSERRWTLTVRQEKRSDEQNRRLWAMLHDISKQIAWHGQYLSEEDWKHIFTASLKKQRAVPGLDGGFVVLGQSTSSMTRAEMSDLIELLFAFGADKDVRWSDPAMEAAA